MVKRPITASRKAFIEPGFRSVSLTRIAPVAYRHIKPSEVEKESRIFNPVRGGPTFVDIPERERIRGANPDSIETPDGFVGSWVGTGGADSWNGPPYNIPKSVTEKISGEYDASVWIFKDDRGKYRAFSEKDVIKYGRVPIYKKIQVPTQRKIILEALRERGGRASLRQIADEIVDKRSKGPEKAIFSAKDDIESEPGYRFVSKWITGGGVLGKLQKEGVVKRVAKGQYELTKKK